MLIKKQRTSHKASLLYRTCILSDYLEGHALKTRGTKFLKSKVFNKQSKLTSATIKFLANETEFHYPFLNLSLQLKGKGWYLNSH